MNERTKKAVDRYNTEILRDRAALIAKIRAFQPSISGEALRVEAAAGGNVKLQYILGCCQEIDRVAIASLSATQGAKR